jgi:IS30 family transposase
MKYEHINGQERHELGDLKHEGFNQKEIALLLGRSPSTISRELKRNKGGRGWRPGQANELAEERLKERGTSNALRINDAAWNYAVKHLREDQWSPEQIAGRIEREGKGRISYETIYQKILEDKRAGGNLYTNLRCQKKRKKRYGSKSARSSAIPNRIDISSRPAMIDDRKRIGDWEGDTIIGSHKGGAVIASMVERKSRFTVLVKSENKTTEAVVSGINNKMEPLASLVHSATFDNGTEFCGHEKLAATLKAKIYFATPYHSWERGLNEHTNGLVRQYFPKKQPFDNISQKQVQGVADKLNHRPRKCLNFKTPFEIFSKACQRAGIALRI